MIYHTAKLDITTNNSWGYPRNKGDAKMALQITGIRKPDPNDSHTAISHFRWHDDVDGTNGIDERVALIKWMEDNKVGAYVSVSAGTVACTIRENQHGTKYLETRPDNTGKDNLLSLPQV
jgi:Protein of unknown function (DUF3892)